MKTDPDEIGIETSSLSDNQCRMIGTTISHYRILEELGRGGMGVVYKALDTKLNRHVALKFLPSFLTEDAEERARFLHEAQALSALNNPHIATIYDVEGEGEHKFIALEFIKGGTLKQKTKHQQLPITEVLDYAIQVAEGLAYAHKEEIVHRDIKTDNMMLTAEGQVKITDFGLAKLKGATKVTRAGSTVGTAAYMSPEQAQGEEADYRSDIFSFGVVLYELVTGELPFKGEHEAALLYEVVHSSPAPLKELRPDLPDDLQRIVGKAMEKNPSNRYENVDQMLMALKGLKKTWETREILEQAGPPTPVQKKKALWFVAAVFALGITAALYFYLGPSSEEVLSKRKMLVVLPFQNLGSPDDEYFADGITEEVTARLAVVEGLGVIARTSAIQYKNTDKTLSQIGEELGVDYALEGTVRWQRLPEGPSRVRVTPQLVRVSDATHVWADVYDHVIHEVFQVQSDIAEQVVKALDVALIDPERRSLEAKPTENVEAYDYFLRGNDYFFRGRVQEDIRRAEEMYKRAVELDPNFALAYARLTGVHTVMYWFHYDRTDGRLEKAKGAADKALQLDPQLPEAHMAMGWYLYQGKLDYDNAVREFAVAQKSQPNNSEASWGMAAAQRRQGRWEEAVKNFSKAASLDPRSEWIAQDLAETHYLMGNFPDAERYFDRVTFLAPDWESPYQFKTSMYLKWEGNTKKARETLEKGAVNVEPTKLVANFILLDVYDGQYQSALDRLSVAPAALVDDQFRYLPKSLLLAEIYELMGRLQLQSAYYDSARTLLETRARDRPEDERYRSALGITYAGLGRKADAIREGKMAVELLPVSKEAWKGAVHLEDLAHIYAKVGEYDAAVDQLEYLLSIPSEISIPLLRLDPKWAPLREHPRFQKLVNAGK